MSTVEQMIRSWSSPDPDDIWEATCILAFENGALEQRWRKPIINAFGHISGWDYEWRKVPSKAKIETQG